MIQWPSGQDTITKLKKKKMQFENGKKVTATKRNILVEGNWQKI